jgi:hypothetical protein
MKPGSNVPRNTSSPTSHATVPSSTGRASVTGATVTQPGPVAAADVWAHFLRPSLSEASLAERREIIGMIERAVLQGDTHLDFQNTNAVALKAVPGAALKALARQVTGVTLPGGLNALPRCLNRLKGLKSIEMTACMARQIDVTPWDLDTLTITGRAELRWVAANDSTRVSCSAPGIRRKVCVNVYRDGKLLGHTAAGSQRYIKVPARRNANMNGALPMLDGRIAFCQSITAWWLGARAERHAGKRSGATNPASDMYCVLKNSRSFRRAVTGDMEKQYDEALVHATRNIMVGNDRFGEVIETEFRRMRRGGIPAQKLFQVNSIEHAMGLELKVKNGRNGKPEYSLVFYDPNVSITHVRIKYHQAREARGLTLTGLFANKNDLPTYFEDQTPVVTLVDLDSVQPGAKRSLAMMLSDREKRSALTLNLVMRDGYDFAAEQLIGDLRSMKEEPVDWEAILLSSSSTRKLPLFIVAKEAGRPRLAAMLADAVISLIAEGGFERTVLFELLQQEALSDGAGFTALGLACEGDDAVFINALIDVLIRPNADGLASPEEYENLLQNGGAGTPSPYACAIRCDHVGATRSMVLAMLSLTNVNRITRDQVVQLLACRNEEGVPAIEKAFAAGNVMLMRAIIEPLISAATADFSARQLCAMLSSARADGTPALRATYQAGHAKFLAAYGTLVLSAVSAERIRPLDAIVLLTATGRGETPREALIAIRPAGDILRTLDNLLHDVRVARWLPHDLSEALDALRTEASSDSLSSDFDTDSASSSLE